MTELSEIVNTLRQSQEDGVLESIQVRKDVINQLILMLDENRDAIVEALHKDLRRPSLESFTTAVFGPKSEGFVFLRNMNTWLSDEQVPLSLMTMFDTPYVQRQPYGVVLIISPWNYPFWASIIPLMAAIAAGNSVVIKPSEYTLASSKLLGDMIKKYISPRICQVYFADAEMCKDMLSKERFDYIFFTGGAKAGRSVYTAASKFLTPVTLELGGKCPAYVDSNVYLKMAAKRIVWSKVINAGQTCVAVDYVLCHKDVVEKFKKAACETIIDFFGENVKESPDFGRIINTMHFDRLTKLLADSKGTVVAGGQTDKDSLYFAPTVVSDVTLDDSLMSEELFGPILPIITVDSPSEAIGIVKSIDKPLGIYVFTNDQTVFNNFKRKTSSGGLVQNDCVSQVAVSELPFGGVGASGIGQYHGRYSIETFSHRRAVLLKTTTDLLYDRTIFPPYTEAKAKLLSWAVTASGKGGCTMI